VPLIRGSSLKAQGSTPY